MTDPSTPVGPAAVEPGEVLGGRYRLLRRIGRGGFGEVFEAEHLHIAGRRVAIKVLDPLLTRDERLKGRFLREVDAASRLVHPHILVLREVDVTAQGLCYCIMDLSPGRSLRALLAERGRLAPAAAARLMGQVLDALAHAHERGVVHRDMKPDNVLVEGPPGDEQARVVDFGLAKLIDEDAGSFTTPGQVLGTFQYMAPEQAQAQRVDGRADQYAVAVMLYELVAGELPFAEGSKVAYLVAHLTKPPPRLAERFPALGVPPALDDAIQRGLAKTPEGRFPDARAFRAALEAAVAPAAALPAVSATAAAPGSAPVRRAAPSAATVAVPAELAAGTAPRPSAHRPVASGGTPYRSASPPAPVASAMPAAAPAPPPPATGTSPTAADALSSGFGAEAPTVGLGVDPSRGGGRPGSGGLGPATVRDRSGPSSDRSGSTTRTEAGAGLGGGPGAAVDSATPTRAAPSGWKAPAPGPSALDIGTGTVIGKYRIEGVIGGGGMGRVYRARHVHMGREAALKVLLPHLARDPVVRERFRREARVAALFRHPSVVELYDYDDLDGLCFLAMELVDGSPLDALLKREGPLAPERAARLVDQLLDALDAAHQAGVVHRDLKPANVMVLRDDRIKVLDFGIARILEAQHQDAPTEGSLAGLTLVGDFIGTPAYAAPEQVQGGKVDGRTDLYTTGVILFQLVAGRLPFVADSPRGYLAQHLVDPPPKLAALRPGLGLADRLDQVIGKALEKRPEARFATAKAMREALRDALGAAAAGAAAGAAAAERGRPRGGAEGGAGPAAGHRLGDASGAVTALGEGGAVGSPAPKLVIPGEAGAADARGPRLLLQVSGAPGLKKLFLIGGERLAFGRGREDKRRGVRNDIVLRVLPCRDPQLDPENWQASVRVSQAHGEIRVRGALATVADQSSRGTAVDGVRVEAAQPRALGDRFELDIGAGAIALGGQVCRAPRGLGAASLEHAETALEDGSPPVTAVLLRRKGNAPDHAYALVVSRLVLGQAARADLGLEVAGVPDQLVAIERQGEGFVAHALGEAPADKPPPRRGWLSVVFGGRDDAAGAAQPLTVDGRPLERGQSTPLGPGTTLRWGGVALEAADLADEAFSAP